MPGHYQMKGMKKMGMNKKMTMNTPQKKICCAQKGICSHEKENGCFTSKKGKKIKI